MESPLSSVPRPLSLDSSVSPCSLLDLSITAESHPLTQVTPHLSQHQPITGQRRNGSAIGRVKSQRVTEASNQLQEPAVTASQCADGAGLNTTLALRAELQTVQEAQWDAVKAVKETLDKNGRTQTLINHRATQGVSFPSHARLYSALVSVHVLEDHVIKEAVQRLPLAPPPKVPPPPSTGPSLLPLTFDLYQRPLPLNPGPTPCLKPCPHSAPFSLYQRQQRWASAL